MIQIEDSNNEKFFINPYVKLNFPFCRFHFEEG